MPVILIADAEVHDPEAYAEYLEKAPAFVKKHGGEYLARDGAFEAIREAATAPRRMPVVEALEDSPA